MPLHPVPVRRWSVPGDRACGGEGGLAPVAARTRASSDHHSLELTVYRLFRRASGCRGPSIRAPIWRVVRFDKVGTAILDHDVSGAGWQTVGRAMQSITTMVPVWQCGHCRNDCPVSASKQSR